MNLATGIDSVLFEKSLPRSSRPGYLVAVLIYLGCAGQQARTESVEPEIQGGSKTTYYVSQAGNDQMNGLTPAEAWKTIARVNRAFLKPGTEVRFRGGDRFVGNLTIQSGECGTTEQPIVITSFDDGRAQIDAGQLWGISISDCGGYEVSNLIFQGAPGNRHSGVQFQTNLGGDVKLEHIRIDNLEVSGFRYGINLASTRNLTGYRDVRITNNRIHDNIRDGIRTEGEWNPSKIGWAHEDIYLAHNTVYNIFGDPAFIENHSGNGIILSDVDGAIIEHNTAYDNGGRNGNPGGGPVGIWAWDCNQVVIQMNESYRNRRRAHDGPGADGDGFDLDGGCGNSIMQYNYAHENDGAGFLVWQFEGARPKTNVTVRYNISVNDGRRLGYGGITIGGDATDGVYVYNNTVYLTPSSVGNGDESALAIWNWKRYKAPSLDNLDNVKIYNNLLMTTGGQELVWVAGVGKGLQFLGNHYDSSRARFRIQMPDRSRYGSIEDWRLATGYERLNGRNFGSAGDARLVNPGGSDPSAYQIDSSSQLRGAGINLREMFGIDPGVRDYFGNPLTVDSQRDIGAHEARDQQSSY
jgi:hypothetical protein